MALLIFSFPTFADANPTHLCFFGKAFVPCIQLAHPVQALPYTFRFRPTKWIPLWPNNTIFGGRDHISLWGDIDFAHINKAEKFDKTKSNIETFEPIQPDFGTVYVDPNLAESSTWMGRETNRYVGLIDTNSAFHGDQVFEFWTQATKVGVVCADFAVPYADSDVSERHCVFARVDVHDKLRNIEYCTFQLFVESGIADVPVCTRVASEQYHARKVLASKYIEWDYDGGESAGEYTCTVPNASQEEVRRTIQDFIRNFIGKSSRYFETSDHGIIHYKAQGINIEDKNEQMFLRAYLFGSYYVPEKGKSGTHEDFSINVNLTVSAQASDNIVDYREPAPAMSDRMRNVFNDNLQKAIRSISRRSGCKLD